MPKKTKRGRAFQSKKKRAGRLRFVLLRDIGDVFVTDEVDHRAILETLQELTVEGITPRP